MYRQEQIKPYGSEGDKGAQVEEMFDNIAPTYDMLNHRLSCDIDKGWRRKAIAQLKPFAPREILDIATGTGDFAILAARMLKPEQLVGADISEGMMAVGRQKVEREGLRDVIHFRREDCLQLSFEDGSFDAVTAAFGIRNFKDLDTCLRELHRVLRPGGHLSIVELSAPMRPPMSWLFKVYSHTLLPLYARLVSKDGSAYRYLINTIEAFPQGEEMMEILRKAGFEEVQFCRLTLGVCTMYLASKK
ncbi:bifunctional demethylmenaquinone methyltransferase/2-methoxy-6-polyprenyl-1,4-benzoquinol methylase UbiE [Prevotella sp. oral taxon 475]|uniref:bifunctional demethylmenaquinone methyltransferase/2-methoxy-6-polyprenyl-1,4-benzoquinol methylase UbiE n=1 Tax=Prevotella sp. oral taxon 475 TaxID=712471 RepID=UPI001BAE2C6E|nr:bifunctional demethylmenaquinone methyltransferase/2-methoxy-6-polyprenyl-1,4-benzoquinol methylase UbiE [Prevotella sp. oral taxon 475]QUB46890.1 bifunctional demethylmenaquinone methyltransferase/2-methoxy-6-polyprenyl-1,4-benzoquinol methylase UbiE [Prevotella sp. oral taxon 475]